jgi:uncharacterized protein (TIGR03435 family)
MNMRAAVLSVLFTSAAVFAQAPTDGPRFEVVSVKRNTSSSPGRIARPADGGYNGVGVTAQGLLTYAYNTVETVTGLPGWATSERYDVNAKSAMARATPAESAAMMRAMLADRFNLFAHFETHEVPAFDLVLARSDRRFGPQLNPSELDCTNVQVAVAARRAAVSTPAAPGGSRRPCAGLRLFGGPLEGDATMPLLALNLSGPAGRKVVDKTDLTGSYRIKLEFNRRAGNAPTVTSNPGEPPSVFTAVEEQLGLKLVSSHTLIQVLVIDRLERPTEN